VAARFKQENINLRSMRILRRDRGHTLVALVADDAERARVVAGADVVLAGID